jgi:hypothetical protein
MKKITYNVFNFFNRNDPNPQTDLTPRGIRSTVKSDNHGTTEDFNNTWIHIISQRRNLELYEKEFNIKIK